MTNWNPATVSHLLALVGKPAPRGIPDHRWLRVCCGEDSALKFAIMCELQDLTPYAG